MTRQSRARTLRGSRRRSRVRPRALRLCLWLCDVEETPRRATTTTRTRTREPSCIWGRTRRLPCRTRSACGRSSAQRRRSLRRTRDAATRRSTTSTSGGTRSEPCRAWWGRERLHRCAVELSEGAPSSPGMLTVLRPPSFCTQVSPATSRITSGGSNDEFPTLNFRQGPQRARSSLGMTPTRRPPFHPSFSRLRSISTQSFPHIAGPGSSGKNRFVSSSTYNTAMEFPASATTSPRRPPFATGVGGTPSTSALDLDGFSRRSSVANLRDLPSASDLPLGEGVPTSNASSAGAGHGAGGGSSLAATAPPARTIKWSSLKRLSGRLYPSSVAGNGGAAEQMARGAMGSPTVMAVSGLVAVGTSKGWVLVFDFGQNLRCVCGTEAIGTSLPVVSRVAQD